MMDGFVLLTGKDQTELTVYYVYGELLDISSGPAFLRRILSRLTS